MQNPGEQREVHFLGRECPAGQGEPGTAASISDVLCKADCASTLGRAAGPMASTNTPVHPTGQGLRQDENAARLNLETKEEVSYPESGASVARS